MPQDSIPKLGNLLFDHKKPLPDNLSIFSDDDGKELFGHYYTMHIMGLMVDLMHHFKISPNDEDQWLKLSMRLTEKYVPGAKFKKRNGVRGTWNNYNEQIFFAYIDCLKILYPNLSKKELYIEASEQWSKTALVEFLATDMKASTIQGEYNKRIKNPNGKAYLEKKNEMNDLNFYGFMKDKIFVSE